MDNDANNNHQKLSIPACDVNFCVQWIEDNFRSNFQTRLWHAGAWKNDDFLQSSSHPQDETISNALSSVSAETAYATHPIDSNDSLVVIPIESRSVIRQIIVGILPTRSIPNLDMMINLLIEQLDLSRLNRQQYLMLEHYSEQVLIGDVELDWYRTLVENLAFHETTAELTSNANKALHQLKTILNAESLVLVLRNQSTSYSADANRIFSIGVPGIHENDIARILEVAGINSHCETYIDLNFRGLSGCSAQQARSIVIVPAICARRCYGWMIAISSIHTMNQREFPWDAVIQERQFDKRTALLMESAASVLATHAHNQKLLNEQQELLLGTVRSLVNTIDTKDKYTWGHSDRVAQMAREVAREYGLTENECEKIYLAGLLHDIGKIGVRDKVLLKTGGLTAEEFAEIKAHPEFGYEILKHLGQLQHILPGVLHHHESWDGTGYPYQLSGNDIPLAARILAVVDAYDAMTSDRPYRKGMPAAKAEEILLNGRSRQWDAEIVDAFFRILDDMHRIASQDSKPFVDPQGNMNKERGFQSTSSGIDPLLSAIKTTTSNRQAFEEPRELRYDMEETTLFLRNQVFRSPNHN